MVQPILFAAAFLGVRAAAGPLFKKDDSSPCFNATIRKEYLLQITTYQPYDPYNSAVMANNFNSIRLHIADPTNQNQDAITCTTASWNSTELPFPSDYLTCSDPTLSYKLTSYTDVSTFSLVINQTFVQGDFSETVLASYNATKKDLNGYACGEKTGCSAYYQNVRTNLIHFKPTFRQNHSHSISQGGQGHAIVYDVQKTGPPSTTFPPQCPPAPLPTPSNWPVRYISEGPEDPADTSSSIASSITFSILTNAQNGYRVKCNGPTWDSTTEPAQPADWYPCPEISYIPGKWSFRVESYTDYQTFNLGVKQHICNEVQCQDNLAYANLTAATRDLDYSDCDGRGKCTASSGFKTVDAPIYAVVNETVIE
jgi:hypothetical protein